MSIAHYMGAWSDGICVLESYCEGTEVKGKGFVT